MHDHAHITVGTDLLARFTGCGGQSPEEAARTPFPLLCVLPCLRSSQLPNRFGATSAQLGSFSAMFMAPLAG